MMVNDDKKASHLQLQPPWGQPSSWPHSKMMQTSAIVTIVIVTMVITVPCTSTGGCSAKGQQNVLNVCLITLILFVDDDTMLCTSPPANANLALPPLAVEPPYATVQQVHHEASASYVSSLAMAVWTPHIPPDLNHSSVFHSFIHWYKHRWAFPSSNHAQTRMIKHEKN